MKHGNRWIVLVLIIAGLQLSACSTNSPTSSTSEEPVRLEQIEGTDFSRVVLSERAAERLDIQTTAVREEQVVRKRTVGGEVMEAETSDSDEVWVRVPLNVSDLNKVDQEQPALILPLGGDEATGVVAQAVTAPAGDVGEESEALYYTVEGADHGLAAGQGVLVELFLSGGGRKKVIPYASVLYGLNGETWLYTSPEPLNFVRHLIVIDYIDGDLAILMEGPEVGTEVVTVGVVELFGAESGVGGGHN